MLKILRAGHRYIAYTSDIGESFRPVAHPIAVSAAYGVSWAYLIGDVAYEGWKAKLKQQGVYQPGIRPWDPIPPLTLEQQQLVSKDARDWKLVSAERAVFQSIASMALPAFTIHSTVRYAGRAMKNVKNPTLRIYGPVGLGLSVVPALPYLFDKPVEEAIEYVFKKGEELYKSA